MRGYDAWLEAPLRAREAQDAAYEAWMETVDEDEFEAMTEAERDSAFEAWCEDMEEGAAEEAAERRAEERAERDWDYDY